MLAQLSIRNVVLIDTIDLQFRAGLNIFTGETGAGKSMLLDSLALALGIRADSSLVSHNQSKASVCAGFEFTSHLDHQTAVHFAEPLNILQSAGLELDSDGLLLRRELLNSGRSRAFVNDQPVSIKLLKSLGEWLLEIHGQFDRMLEPSYHIELLDQYSRLRQHRKELSKAYVKWQQTQAAREKLLAQFQQLKNDEEYFRHMLQELQQLAPEPNEEELLLEERQLHLQTDKLTTIYKRINESLFEPSDVRKALAQAEKEAVRLEPLQPESAQILREALQRVFAEFDELTEVIASQQSSIAGSPHRLEEIDDRLHLLREQARKHRVPVTELPQQLERMQEKIKLLDDFEERLAALDREETSTKQAYTKLAEEISIQREKQGKMLSESVMSELPPLKLGNAHFHVAVEKKNETDWSATGWDKVCFQVSMNPGQQLSELHKTASGGERSRLMLALKVALASKSKLPTILFDEIDSGVGGAVAEAIGQRLKKLSKNMQVFVITHSPQVASFADQHYHVSKAAKDGSAKTIVQQLSEQQRLDEISRMLSGADVTDAARQAAEQLVAASLQYADNISPA